MRCILEGYKQVINEQKAWEIIVSEAQFELDKEPVLSTFLYSTILHHKSFSDALLYHLASKLGGSTLEDRSWMKVISDALSSDETIAESACYDLHAIVERDPASNGYMSSMLYYKGFLALQCYRVANWYWKNGRGFLASFIQSRMSEVFSVDIHPASQIGTGIFIDHAHGIVIGETAIVENCVSMLHGVTLGGTGKDKGDRHPKVRHGVLIGAGAKVLGNIEIGTGAKIAASSVVLDDVPEHATVAGIPAVIIGHLGTKEPALEMDHSLLKD